METPTRGGWAPSNQAALVGEGLGGAIGGDFDDLQVAVSEDDMPDGGLHGVADGPERAVPRRGISTVMTSGKRARGRGRSDSPAGLWQV